MLLSLFLMLCAKVCFVVLTMATGFIAMAMVNEKGCLFDIA